jgi:hypothetical protein
LFLHIILLRIIRVYPNRPFNRDCKAFAPWTKADISNIKVIQLRAVN